MRIHLAIVVMVIVPVMLVQPTQSPAQTSSESPQLSSPESLPPPASDLTKPPADATATSSGLATKILKSGTGIAHPAKDEVVTVNYKAWMTDGKMVLSRTPDNPLTVNVGLLLPGLSEGVRLMVSGETRMMWIPEALAFKGQPGKPKGMLVFELTLVDLPLRAPANLKSPPPDALHSPNGMQYEVLRQGSGTRHPKKVDEVTVHYTGWTTNGQMFDSSVKKGQPATFPLDRVIPGWTEALQLMVEGEKARFWIPERLGYQGRTPPYGMLVFDIELLKIR